METSRDRPCRSLPRHGLLLLYCVTLGTLPGTDPIEQPAGSYLAVLISPLEELSVVAPILYSAMIGMLQVFEALQ